jgi:hypothetical protein
MQIEFPNNFYEIQNLKNSQDIYNYKHKYMK